MAIHIEKLEISSYRGVRNLKMDDLGDVNIFVGDNNTGKTSVLEAIQFLCEPNQYKLVQIARQREKYRARMGISLFDSMRYLFDVSDSFGEHMRMDIGGTILGEKGFVHVEGKLGTQLIDANELVNKHIIPRSHIGDQPEEVDTFFGKIESVSDDYNQLNIFGHIVEEFEINNYSRLRRGFDEENRILRNRTILTVDHVVENAFNDLIKNSVLKRKAVELLREEFEDDIVDLRIINDLSARYIPVVEKESGEYIPLSLYGDGMKKALTMLNAIVSTENGVVLVDEFETALHTSAMERAFSFVIESARKQRVQLFMTTHSLEAVDKILESAGDYANNIRIIRLKKKNGKTFSRVTNGYEALEDRKNYDLELRV